MGPMVSFDLLGPLPATKNGNFYVILIVAWFSRHAEGYAMTKDEKAARGCTSKIVDDYIPRWGVLTPFDQIEVQNLSPRLVELCMRH